MYIVLGSIALGIALFCLEHHQRLHDRPRLSTFLCASARMAKETFWKIGHFVAKISNLIDLLFRLCKFIQQLLWRLCKFIQQWLCRLWNFIQQWIPFTELVKTLLSLVVPLIHLVLSPFYFFKGYVQTLFTFAESWPITAAVTIAGAGVLFIAVSNAYTLRTQVVDALLLSLGRFVQ